MRSTRRLTGGATAGDGPWAHWDAWSSERGWDVEATARSIMVHGVEQGWSVRVASEDIELPSTEVRVRYQRIGPLPLITLRRHNRDVRVRRGWWFTLHRRPSALGDSVVAAFRASPADRLLVESYSGDSRAFRADGLRVVAGRLIESPADLDSMVALAVLTAEHLREIGAVIPRPAPVPSR